MPRPASNFDYFVMVLDISESYQFFNPFIFNVSENKVRMIVEFIQVMLAGMLFVPLFESFFGWFHSFSKINAANLLSGDMN